MGACAVNLLLTEVINNVAGRQSKSLRGRFGATGASIEPRAHIASLPLPRICRSSMSLLID